MLIVYTVILESLNSQLYLVFALQLYFVNASTAYSYAASKFPMKTKAVYIVSYHLQVSTSLLFLLVTINIQRLFQYKV